MIIRKRRNGTGCSSFTFEAQLGEADVKRYCLELAEAGLAEQPISEQDFMFPLTHNDVYKYTPLRLQFKHAHTIAQWYLEAAIKFRLLIPSHVAENCWLLSVKGLKRPGRPKNEDE